MIYLLDLDLIPTNYEGTLQIQKISTEQVKEILKEEFVPFICHDENAEDLSTLLGIKIPQPPMFERKSIYSLKPVHGDVFIIFSFVMPPLQRLLNSDKLTSEQIEAKCQWRMASFTSNSLPN
jgi:hypothetical protein